MHIADPERVHHAWDNSLEPALTIEPGDSVAFDLRMAGHGQVQRGAGYEATSFDFDTLYHLAGPIAVSGAHPGDTLEIEILSLDPGDWAWCAILPGEGLLPGDFPDPYLRTFELNGASQVALSAGVEVRLDPFLGTMGTHPDEPGVHSVFPPHKGGGNVDTRHLRRGATLWLPVWCEGALFSCGDPHAAQGDGEVCVAALECDMRAELRFELRKRTIGAPRFATADHVGTMGIGPDLMENSRAAVREMIDLVVDRWGLTREDAYMLCSLAGDLKILEIVDAGVWNVGFTLPLAAFG